MSQSSAVLGEVAQAVLAMAVTPAGKGLSIRTAKLRLAVAPPPAREPIERPQVPPGSGEVQLHPGEEEAGSKRVWSGTVSPRETEEAPWLPVFWTEIW